MKTSILIILLMLSLKAQSQKVDAITNTPGETAVRGINTDDTSFSSYGIYGEGYIGVNGVGAEVDGIGVFGGSFGGIGVSGSSTNSIAVQGLSSFGTGVYGNSLHRHGARFGGNNNSGYADIILEGGNWFDDDDDGVITSDTSSSSDLILVANDAVIVSIDTDGGETGQFLVWDGKREEGVFEVQDDGDIFVNGSMVTLSDVNRKENIVTVNESDILNLISQMPIYEWQFIGKNRRHIGPMAQDFHMAFGLGEDNKFIANIDINGVSLAGIKALHRQNEKLKQEVNSYEARMTSLEAELSHIKDLLKKQLNSNSGG